MFVHTDFDILWQRAAVTYQIDLRGWRSEYANQREREREREREGRGRGRKRAEGEREREREKEMYKCVDQYRRTYRRDIPIN